MRARLSPRVVRSDSTQSHKTATRGWPAEAPDFASIEMTLAPAAAARRAATSGTRTTAGESSRSPSIIFQPGPPHLGQAGPRHIVSIGVAWAGRKVRRLWKEL